MRSWNIEEGRTKKGGGKAMTFEDLEGWQQARQLSRLKN
jgi:hypothetical protein